MRTAYISIVGRANVGKSTLLNAIIGEKISIVSNKPQTTRNRITGIYNRDDMQLVFVDTPGMHTPHNKLGEHMVKAAKEAMDDVDAAILVVECKPPRTTEKRIIERLNAEGTPTVLVINKIDRVKKSEIIKTIEEYSKLGEFASIVPISALKKDGVKIVLDEIMPFTNEDGVQYYPDDIDTDQTVRQMASELVREKILRNMHDEIPHGIAVEPLVFKDRENKNGEPVTDIVLNIICEKESHKGMLIGKAGSMLKKTASEARADIEKLLGNKVNLQCYVKVKENWRDSEKIITELALFDD
jgi:GTP-binding protein Era